MLTKKTLAQHLSDGGVPVSNQTSGRKVSDLKVICRPKAQLEGLIKFHEEHPFEHWCGNPFQVDVPGEMHRCKFAHLFYADGILHFCHVKANGTVINHGSIDKYGVVVYL